MTDRYCVMPFVALQTRPTGEIRPCGVFKTPISTNTKDLYQAFNSDEMNNLRRSMLNNEHVNGCSKCYFVEAAGSSSLRQWMNTRFGRRELPSHEFLEISFSNICNLKCRSCSSLSSTKWITEDKKLNRPVVGLTAPEYGNIPYSSLRYVKVLGGEPLLHSEEIEDLIKNVELYGNVKNLTIEFATNLTILPPPSLLDALKKCKKVNMQASIDATGGLNDYIRTDSVWDTVSKNFIFMTKELGFDCLLINTVVTVLNINMLDELADWVKIHTPMIYQNFSIAKNPPQLAINNLPDSTKKFIKENFLNKFDNPESSDNYKKLIQYLDSPQTISPSKVAEFVNRLDQFRRENFASVNPWMSDQLAQI